VVPAPGVAAFLVSPSAPPEEPGHRAAAGAGLCTPPTRKTEQVTSQQVAPIPGRQADRSEAFGSLCSERRRFGIPLSGRFV